LVMLLITLALMTSCVTQPVRNIYVIKAIPCDKLKAITMSKKDTEETKTQIDDYNIAYDVICEGVK
jgi:hypothetical protein